MIVLVIVSLQLLGLLDGFAGLWCVNAGYGQPTIIEGALFSPDPKAEKSLALLRGQEVTGDRPRGTLLTRGEA